MPLVSSSHLTKSGNELDLYIAYDLSGGLKGKAEGITGSVQYKDASGNFAGNSGLVYDGVSKISNQDSGNSVNLNDNNNLTLTAQGATNLVYPDSTPGFLTVGYVDVSKELILELPALIRADNNHGSAGQVLTSKGDDLGVKWDDNIKSIQFSTNEPAIGELTFTGFVEQTGNTFNFTGGSGGGGQVNSVVAGTNIAVDSVDPINPVVSVVPGGTESQQLQFATTSGTLGGANIFYDNATALYTEAGSATNNIDFKTGSENVITLKSVGGDVKIVNAGLNPGGVSLKTITNPTSGNNINLKNSVSGISITTSPTKPVAFLNTSGGLGDIVAGNVNAGNILTAGAILDLPNNSFIRINNDIGSEGQVVTSKGGSAGTKWATIPPPTPAGTNGQLQYNNNGVLGASAIVSNGGTILTEPTYNNSIDLKNTIDSGITILVDPNEETDGAVYIRANATYIQNRNGDPGAIDTGGLFMSGSILLNGNSGVAGQVLTSQGSLTPVVWADIPAPTPAGIDGQLQYNNNGVLGASGITSDGGNKLIGGQYNNIINFDEGYDIVITADPTNGGSIRLQTSTAVFIENPPGITSLPQLVTPSAQVTTNLVLSDNCSLQDNLNNTGGANQILSAGVAGGKVRWVDPPAPGGVENSIQVKGSGGDFVGSALKVVDSSLVAGSLSAGTDVTLNMNATVGSYVNSASLSRDPGSGALPVFLNTNNGGVFTDTLYPTLLSFQAQAGASGTPFEAPGIIQDTTGSFGVPGQVLTATANGLNNPLPNWTWGTVPSGTATIGGVTGYSEYWIQLPDGIVSSLDAPISVTLQKPDGATQNWIVYAELIQGTSIVAKFIHVSFSFAVTNAGTTISWAINNPFANTVSITNVDPT